MNILIREALKYILKQGGMADHLRDFKVHKENETELSKYIWKLKNNNTVYNINWKILHRAYEESAKNLYDLYL